MRPGPSDGLGPALKVNHKLAIMQRAYRRLKHTPPSIASSPRWRKFRRGYHNNGFQVSLRSRSFLGAQSGARTPHYDWRAAECLISEMTRRNASCSSPFRLSYEPVMVLGGSQLQFRGNIMYLSVQNLFWLFKYCSHRLQYVQSFNSCKVHTVPGPLLKVAREYHLSGIQYASSSQHDPSDIGAEAVFMTKWSDRCAFPNLGRRPPFMDSGSCLGTFACRRLFDETAYVLLSRLMCSAVCCP